MGIPTVLPEKLATALDGKSASLKIYLTLTLLPPWQVYCTVFGLMALAEIAIMPAVATIRLKASFFMIFSLCISHNDL